MTWDHEPIDKAAAMRMRLAAVGIYLPDEVVEPATPTPKMFEPDRATIRAYLETLDAPEWAIISCPSLDLARTFRRSQ